VEWIDDEEQRRWREWLARFLSASAVRQYELADRAGLTEATVSRMLSGRSPVTRAVADAARELYAEWLGDVAEVSATAPPAWEGDDEVVGEYVLGTGS